KASGFAWSQYLEEMTLPAPDHWRNALIIVPIVGTTVATIFFILRLCCRYVVAHKLRVEDLLMGMGLLCTYGVATCQVYCKYLGLFSTLANWILIKFWPSAQLFVKTSIVLFLRRLFGLNKRFRHAATAVIIFVVAWGLTALIGNTLQCWPVQYYWIRSIEGHCMSGQDTFFLVIGSLSVVEDVVILCLPLPIVWDLHTSTRQKLQMTVLFSMGCLTNPYVSHRVCIFSILRLVELKHYQTGNLTGKVPLLPLQNLSSDVMSSEHLVELDLDHLGIRHGNYLWLSVTHEAYIPTCHRNRPEERHKTERTLLP
ncbi:hypothetical protein N7510_009691, partial [Penicillium lagena]|uniref:uncharacterized protein n=1 Tax=Penicillium lagena TaxID=94218 RepID=UPI0025421DE9